MVKVDRALQYTRLSSEDRRKTPEENKPKGVWPDKGSIRFDNVTYSYDSNGQKVLKDISFKINGGEKIGIIGRTGAGKSSLIEALFRMSDCTRGTISIDGVNLRSIGLDDSRNCLSVITQNPTLFTGSLRYNLDPFNEKTNEELWQVLKNVQMSQTISKIGGLNFFVKDYGSNLSCGQKQLICLARAILKETNILILDEATSNVDQKTDLIIQKTIRNSFKNKTVIIIAHRLNALKEVDKIMILSDGKLVKYDETKQLLPDDDVLLNEYIERFFD